MLKLIVSVGLFRPGKLGNKRTVSLYKDMKLGGGGEVRGIPGRSKGCDYYQNIVIYSQIIKYIKVNKNVKKIMNPISQQLWRTLFWTLAT